MTYYIVNRKVNNFSRMSSFAVTVAVATCDSLCVCALSASTSSMSHLFCLRLLCLGESSACLRLIWLALSASAVCSVCICYALVSRLLYLHLLSIPLLYCLVPCPLRLYLLCLGESFAPSVSSVACSICVCCLCLDCFVCFCCILVSYLLRQRVS